MDTKIGKALVVGAGIGGIRAALDLAETGYRVTLIDRAPHLGGILSQLDYQFPTDRCGMCKMLPLVDRDAASQYCLRKGLFHENIDIHLSTELIAVEGESGHFSVTLREKPRWIDPSLCIGCGECERVCPVETGDLFNAGLSKRKAVYLPVPHAIPNPYVIDTAACTRCGECEPVCPTAAICLGEHERRGFRILVVDDELIVRDSLKEWLEEEGFAVDMADSGPAALQMLSEAEYRLMLIDIKMPGMDGVEALQRAKEDHPDLVVVMMTAYATVETAVEAMKLGALDYLIKPFDPEKLVPMVVGIYEDLEVARGRQVDVGAIVLCGGTDYYDPAVGKNVFGYGQWPGVMTSLEFERLFSGTGPTAGALVRPSDRRPVRRMAWIQCVGSRDLQTDADFCSNICCMYSIKEARLARRKTGAKVETTIFFMDMRTFGKPFQRYRDRAETEYGVRFERGRVHSVVCDPASGDLVIRYVDRGGGVSESAQDLVILAVGQRPAAGAGALAATLDLPLNAWGFFETEPFRLTHSRREGIFMGGSITGLKDISESVIQSSAAALSASRAIHAAGGSLKPTGIAADLPESLLREEPRILVVLCGCKDTLNAVVDFDLLKDRLGMDPQVDAVVMASAVCTAEGWEEMVDRIKNHHPNRLLIGACLPYVYARKLRQLGQEVNLQPALMEVVDIRTAVFSPGAGADQGDRAHLADLQLAALKTGLARLKHIDPAPDQSLAVNQQALVIGGGIAGLTAALAIADHGYAVDLIERQDRVGGNLLWLNHTLEGHLPADLLEETLQKIERHPLITLHTRSRVMAAHGQVGRFFTTVEKTSEDGQASVLTIEHGITILATGGQEAHTTAYGYETSPAVITHKELEQQLNDNRIDPSRLQSVVMIQCVDCREEPRNYCSRVCCSAAVKHALFLKQANPDIAIYVLYRDMMTYGFSETYFTRARAAGVFFVEYTLDRKPRVNNTAAGLQVTVHEPIVDRELLLEADLVVLATGVVPNLPADLAAAYGATLDQDGFFNEADSKWRPVDTLAEGVFACGLAHSPRNVAESIATAEAAAERSLRILCRKQLPAAGTTARVHHSLCSLCERCIETCPYGARSLDADNQKVVVNPAMCQGCGACAAVCPNSASVLEGYRPAQMLETIDAAMEGVFGR